MRVRKGVTIAASDSQLRQGALAFLALVRGHEVV